MGMNIKEKQEMLGNMILNKLLENLESGETHVWKNPVAHPEILPFNMVTKHVYTGTNTVLLQLAMAIKRAKTGEPADPRFVTTTQMKYKGWHFKPELKGKAHAYPIITVKLFIPAKYKNDKTLTPKEKEQHMAKFVGFSLVCNVSDLEGFEPMRDSIRNHLAWTRKDRQTFFENMIKNSEAPIMYDAEVYNNGINCYNPTFDVIHMCHRKTFGSHDLFYDTCAHEIAHSTGVEKRLARKQFDSYAHEEMVAELAATILRLEFGGVNSKAINEQHMAYLESWFRELKDTPEEFYTIARDAGKAVEYIKKNMMFKGIQSDTARLEEKLHFYMQGDDFLGTDTAPESPKKKARAKKSTKKAAPKVEETKTEESASVEGTTEVKTA